MKSVRVACLCAAWCHTCNEYRPTFDAVCAAFGERVQRRWIDIEDEAALVGDAVDVVDFPTLLVAHGDRVLFYGPLLPHARTLKALLQRATDDGLGEVDDAALHALAGRIR